jgi:putative DNA primase/helicase
MTAQTDDLWLTDAGNAELLVRLAGRDLRWCEAMVGSGWLVWDGHRWRPDNTRQVTREAMKVAQAWLTSLPQECADLVKSTKEEANNKRRKAILQHAAKCQSASAIRAMLDLAAAHPRIATQRDAFDKDPWLFNAANATFDLKRECAYSQRREDLIMKVGGVAYANNAECPTWVAFLHRIMKGNTALIEFLQRAVGYSMTGETSEQCLFILHGEGSNGKGTFVEVVRHVLGDYARNTPIETFTQKREGGIPNDIAALAGARFVTASESQEGVTLNEALVKNATGDDTLTARFLNREYFDFLPAFKIWIQTNHRPVIRGTDNGIWRRICLIPFEVTIPKDERDKMLKHKLRAEAPGILRWCLEGASKWIAEGLKPPAEVDAANAAYRSDMDVAQAWIDECCVTGPGAGPTQFKFLYASYRNWCTENGMHAHKSKWLAQQLESKGYPKPARNGDAVCRERIALVSAAPQRQGRMPPDDGRWAPFPD